MPSGGKGGPMIAVAMAPEPVASTMVITGAVYPRHHVPPVKPV